MSRRRRARAAFRRPRETVDYEERWGTVGEDTRRITRVMPCKYFYRIQTEVVPVPEELQRETRLPGNPQGDERTGFSLFRRRLLTVAMQDKCAGGRPIISKVDVNSQN
jgi:hypothetical protein